MNLYLVLGPGGEEVLSIGDTAADAFAAIWERDGSTDEVVECTSPVNVPVKARMCVEPITKWSRDMGIDDDGHPFDNFNLRVDCRRNLEFWLEMSFPASMLKIMPLN